MVDMLNRNDTITKAPHPGLLGGILPVAPRGQLGMLHDYITPAETIVTYPNQDMVYGLGFFSLDDEPVIIQAPDFGDRFWVYSIYDMRADQVGELCKPYGSKPSFYLLVGSSWKGNKPEGVEGAHGFWPVNEAAPSKSGIGGRGGEGSPFVMGVRMYSQVGNLRIW